MNHWSRRTCWYSLLTATCSSRQNTKVFFPGTAYHGNGRPELICVTMAIISVLGKQHACRCGLCFSIANQHKISAMHKWVAQRPVQLGYLEVICSILS